MIFGDPEHHVDYSYLKTEVRKRILRIFGELKLLQKGKVKNGDGSKFTQRTVHEIADRVHHLMEYEFELFTFFRNNN